MGCAHMNPDESCGSCAPEKLRELRSVVRGLVEALEGIRDEAYAMLDEEQPESSRYNGALMKLGYQAGAALATARELVGR